MNDDRVFRSAFLDRVSKRVSISQVALKRTVAAFLDELLETVNEGRSVIFPGFGRFYPRKISKMRRFAPWYGDFVEIPEHHVFAFEPCDGARQIENSAMNKPMEAAENPEH